MGIGMKGRVGARTVLSTDLNTRRTEERADPHPRSPVMASQTRRDGGYGADVEGSLFIYFLPMRVKPQVALYTIQ